MAFLEHIFGAKRIEVWKKISEELQGEFIENFWSKDKIRANYKNWKIILDTIEKPSYQLAGFETRIFIPYITDKEFFFDLHQRTFWSSVEDKIGFVSEKTGFEEFDKNFTLISNGTEQIKQIIDTKIINLISALKPIRISLQPSPELLVKLPERHNVLIVEKPGRISDYNQLLELINICKLLMDNMLSLNIITQEKTTETYFV